MSAPPVSHRTELLDFLRKWGTDVESPEFKARMAQVQPLSYEDMREAYNKHLILPRDDESPPQFVRRTPDPSGDSAPAPAVTKQ